MKRWIRIVLAVLTSLIGLTAVAGGTALIIGAVTSSQGGAVPPQAFLGGSPFTSYVTPGLLLAVVVGGAHLTAAVLTGRGSPAGPFAVAVAGFGLLIWIFVQMMFIPFSPLQAAYFVAGLAELGFVLLGLGLFERRTTPGRPAGSARPEPAGRAAHPANPDPADHPAHPEPADQPDPAAHAARTDEASVGARGERREA